MFWVPVYDESLWLKHRLDDVVMHGLGTPPIRGVAQSLPAACAED